MDIEQISGRGANGGSRGFGFFRRAMTIGFFIAVIWMVWVVDAVVFGGRLMEFGVMPRSVRGLPGVLWAPFLHGGWSHLLNNSLAILFLGGLLILRSEAAFWSVTIFGGLAAGIGTWVIGRGSSVHIGASGVIFAYFGYLLFAGIFERRIGSLLLSLIVFFLWGGMLWSVLPAFGTGAVGTISWEGHLSGFVGGMMCAKALARTKPSDDRG